jgi:hypothetical protein
MKGVVLEGQRLPGSWAGAPGPGKSRSRLIVASNRLPVVLGKDAEGRWSVKPGSGGLITALVPVLQERGGTWIGWPGTSNGDGDLVHAVIQAGERFGYTLRPVMLSPAEVEGFYAGFANEVLCPCSTICSRSAISTRSTGRAIERSTGGLPRRSLRPRPTKISSGSTITISCTWPPICESSACSRLSGFSCIVPFRRSTSF